MTTNRALQMLTSEGLVTRKAGHGTTVADQSTQHQGTLRPSESELYFDSRPNLIGFVIPRLDDEVGSTLIASLEAKLHECDAILAVGCSLGDIPSETAIIEKFVQNGARGLIIFPTNSEFYNPAILRLHVSGFPIVLVDKQLQGIPLPYVTTDNKAAAELLMNHLIELGHSHIAFYSHDWINVSSLSARYEGYQHALLAAHLPMRSEYVLVPTSWDHDGERYYPPTVDEIVQFLIANPEITAVFASEHQLAEYAYIAARRLGKSVPRDLSIVCFDGPSSNKPFFTFTRAVQDETGMAQHALDILLDLTKNEAPRSDAVVLPASIILGESTTPPRLIIERRKAE